MAAARAFPLGSMVSRVVSASAARVLPRSAPPLYILRTPAAAAADPGRRARPGVRCMAAGSPAHVYAEEKGEGFRTTILSGRHQVELTVGRG